MSEPTKILTVSYGTFSCTLEGFDDPIGSMREMAEYFRDLAADDRYFGAEPPTPDVEMLQRIAEKEVQRRVEARVTETGVALVAAEPQVSAPQPAGSEAALPSVSAGTEAQTAKAPAPVQDIQPDPQDIEPDRDAVTSGPLTYDDQFLMPDEPEDVLTSDPAALSHTTGPAETVAEKLRRIREVVSKNIETDREAARREQAPNAEDPDLRDRALTETIQQIQEGLDEDDTTEAEALAEFETPAEEATQDTVTDDVDEADDGPGSQDVDFEIDDLLSDDFEDDDLEVADDEGGSKRQRSLTEVVGDVTSKLAEADLDDASAPAKPRVTTRSLSPEPEVDVGRLLDETDSKLNDDDTVRRRRVISQMRAAVAATKADRMVSQNSSSGDADAAEKDRYKEDLSEAVQDAPAAEKPERSTTVAPLVLVSSQRIDSQPQDAGGDVADFAAEMGAKELPELMEAAAAFAVFSEGQSSFTRPEIMQMVNRMDPSIDLSREEGLRSFGQLLRDGTFKKLERGQFTIDQGTKYNPELRAAGG